ncbi:MAG: phospho-N-acetylmuramoyl-pentapeptide-transferase [Spirochaetales bacterium]|nr:phospho-N-acetylmuramoyl-pentapeptide-transferase [Spirochaetales bacterium]
MVLKFLYPLVEYFTAFNIFQYITFRAAYAAVTALLLTFLVGPWMIRKLTKLKIGQEIREDGPETHLAKSGTPTMGGVLMIISIVISILLWQDLDSINTWIIIICVSGFGLIGFVDDYLKITKKNAAGLTGWFKWSAQVILAFGIALLIFLTRVPLEDKAHLGTILVDPTTFLFVPFTSSPVLDFSEFYIPFAMILLLSTTNAVNLTDGLDGLATGLMIIVGITLAVLAYLSANINFAKYLGIPFIRAGGELTISCLALVGACVGFLWYNSHPAQVMMGDTGSLALGGLAGVLSMILKKEILLIVIMGVFVLETLSVIIQVGSFKLFRKRIFKMAPLHHHFELKGWDESKVVIRFWILGGLFALISLSTLKIQ